MTAGYQVLMDLSLTLSQSRWAAGKFHVSMFSCACPGVELASAHLELIWSNLLQIFKTSVDVSSPPVHQLPHVGNRLSCSLLLSQVYVPCSLCFSSVDMSRLHSSAQLTTQTPGHTVHVPPTGRFPILLLPALLPPLYTGPLGTQAIISTPLTWNFTFSPQSTTDSTCNVSHTPLLKHLEEFTNPFLSSLLSATTLVTSHALCLP